MVVLGYIMFAEILRENAYRLNVPSDLIFAFSSETKNAVEELWEVIEESLNS